MAKFSLPRKKNCLARLKSLLTFQNFNRTVVEGGHLAEVYTDLGHGGIKFPKWRRLDGRKIRINQSLIPQTPWIVLKILQIAGFEAYFVGGCVRDLILNRLPKDFDVVTSAALGQVKKQFHSAIIFGKKFPICQVNIEGCVVEVSSFYTVAEHHRGKENFPVCQLPKSFDEKDLIRWRNCMQRDFTVNSLFYDPFTNKIYDYVNALSDIKMLKLQTIVPAQLSFEEDCARILRGLRLAARLGMSFSKETESAIHKLSSSILSLSKVRIMMELNYMLSYGAAEPSLSLLQRFHLLEILLPVHAAQLTGQARERSDQSSFMLMKLFSNLDHLVGCDRPAHRSVWVAILAFHLALFSNPQQPLVVLIFGSILYFGKWKEGVKFARDHAQEVHCYVPEISVYSNSFSDDELAEEVTKLAIQVQKSVRILTETDFLLEEMEKYPESSSPGLVFVPRKDAAIVDRIFEVLVKDLTSFWTRRESLGINYDALKEGHLPELRFVLGKIILRTMGIGNVAQGGEVIAEEERDFHALDRRKILEEFTENYHAGDERMAVKQHAACMEESIIGKKPRFRENSCSFLEQGRSKNQKVAADTCPITIAEKKQDSMEDSPGLVTTRNYQKVISEGIGCVLQDYASKMLKKNDSHQVCRNEIQPLLQTLKCQERKPQVAAMEQKPVGVKKRSNMILRRI